MLSREVVMTNDNRACPKSIDASLNEVTSTIYARREVEALLAYNGRKMLAHLLEDISQQYRASCTDENNVPPEQMWPLATLKAYDVFIPLCEAWLADLKAAQGTLESQTNVNST